MKTVIARHGTGVRIVIKTVLPGMIVPITKNAMRISVGVSPIVSTPNEPVAVLKSA